VVPDNNVAKRALRHVVIRRKLSLSTASEAGSRFVERMLSMDVTCCRRGESVASFLTACFVAKGRATYPVPAVLRRCSPGYAR
jgi:transposase